MNKLFGIRYHPDHMRKILRRLGFTVQLPRRELSRADPVDQSHWLTQELAVLKKKSSRSVECSSTRTKPHLAKPAPSIERGQKKGQGTTVESFPGRKSVKVMGAVRVGEQPGWHFRFVERYNTGSFLAFIEQLLRYYKGRKIHLVVDNAPWHKTREIRKWLQEISHLIEVHFRPKYSPKLNAAEYIWKESRKWAAHNRFFGLVTDLKDSLFRRFNRFQGNPASLRTLVPYFA